MSVLFDVKNFGPLNLEGHIIHPLADFRKTNLAFVALGQCGGKIAVDFNRIGNYVSLFNTAPEDLLDAESKLKEIGNNRYKVTQFSGFGAKKDRAIGLKAVRESIPILQEELLADENLYDADFVWVVAALGGGTGSGAITDVSKIISQLIRNEHKRLGYEANEDFVIHEGKPTVGVIAAIPDDSSGHQLKLNAAQALQELMQLQNEGIIGSILIVDNQKLIDTAQNNIDSKEKWHVRGNATIAELITEITMTSSIPAEESFDKSELLDIFSEPGFLSISKNDINSITKLDIVSETEKLFQSDIFADGYNLEEALISSLLLVKPMNYDIITPLDEIKMRTAFSETVSNVRYVHFGTYDVQTTHKYTDVLKNITRNNAVGKSDRALMYSLTIFKNPPQKIINMTKTALDKRQSSEASLNGAVSDFGSLEIKSTGNAPQRRKEGHQSLEDLLGTKTKTTQVNKIANLLGIQ